MSFFKKETPAIFVPFRVKTAQQIYDLYKQGLDHIQMFMNPGIAVPFEDSLAVFNEMNRLESEILSKMAGTFVITPEVGHFSEDETPVWVVDTAEVRYVPTTRENLVASLHSDLLDIHILTADCIVYDPDYNETRTWSEFIAAYAPVVNPIPEMP